MESFANVVGIGLLKNEEKIRHMAQLLHLLRN